MKILGLNARRFLIARVNAKLIDYASKMEFFPERIFCFKMQDSLGSLQKLFPSSLIKQLEISDLKSAVFSEISSTDLILVNFSFEMPSDFVQVLRDIKNLMKKNDIVILASLVYKDEIIEELQILESLHAFDDLFVTTFREPLLDDRNISESYDTHIFVISQKQLPSFSLAKESDKNDSQNDDEKKFASEPDFLANTSVHDNNSEDIVSEVDLDSDKKEQVFNNEDLLPDELNDDIATEAVKAEDFLKSEDASETTSSELKSEESSSNESENMVEDESVVEREDVLSESANDENNAGEEKDTDFLNEIDDVENNEEQDNEGEANSEDEQDNEIDNDEDGEEDNEEDMEEDSEEDKDSEGESENENQDPEHDASGSNDADTENNSGDDDSDDAPSIIKDTAKVVPVLQFNLLHSQKYENNESKEMNNEGQKERFLKK